LACTVQRDQLPLRYPISPIHSDFLVPFPRSLGFRELLPSLTTRFLLGKKYIFPFVDNGPRLGTLLRWRLSFFSGNFHLLFQFLTVSSPPAKEFHLFLSSLTPGSRTKDLFSLTQPPSFPSALVPLGMALFFPNFIGFPPTHHTMRPVDPLVPKSSNLLDILLELLRSVLTIFMSPRPSPPPPFADSQTPPPSSPQTSRPAHFRASL